MSVTLRYSIIINVTTHKCVTKWRKGAGGHPLPLREVGEELLARGGQGARGEVGSILRRGLRGRGLPGSTTEGVLALDYFNISTIHSQFIEDDDRRSIFSNFVFHIY